MKIKKIVAAMAVVCAATLLLTSCDFAGSTNKRETQLEQSQKGFDSRTPPKVTGETEYNNYIKAQEDVYDDPSTILWCTSSFPNPASPIFTVPIAGKLTSSSVSYFPNQNYKSWGNGVMIEAQSVDGMYHGSPIGYRYGFTPGNQYMDFTDMSMVCTTALTMFQRQTLSLSLPDPEGLTVTDQAEKLLKAGDNAGAQKLLDGLVEK